MFRRVSLLFSFELKKILARKKAILFLLALNIVPILAALAAMLVYLKMRSFGLGNVDYVALAKMMQALFTAHIKFFTWISPFFLALVVGDGISGEIGHGHLKTLLLAPVSRTQVLLAKSAAFLSFLLIAITLGGLFLQMNLWVAHSMTKSGTLINLEDNGAALVDSAALLRLSIISFTANLVMTAYFCLIAIFFETPILMVFVSLIILMAMQTYVMMAPYLEKLDVSYAKWVPLCFTRHISELTDIKIIDGIIKKSLTLTDAEVYKPLFSGIGWAVLFFALGVIVFKRRQILS